VQALDHSRGYVLCVWNRYTKTRLHVEVGFLYRKGNWSFVCHEVVVNCMVGSAHGCMTKMTNFHVGITHLSLYHHVNDL